MKCPHCQEEIPKMKRIKGKNESCGNCEHSGEYDKCELDDRSLSVWDLRHTSCDKWKIDASKRRRVFYGVQGDIS